MRHLLNAWTCVMLMSLLAAMPTAMARNETSQYAPSADPADVQSIDAIISAVYDVISGPARHARDWDRWRSLFTPDARLIPTEKHPEGGYSYRAVSADGYIERTRSYLEENGFFEYELHRETETFGNIAHAFSTYAARQTADGPVMMRGINSFQLYFDGRRWWVMSIMWAAERSDLTIPESYLP